MLSDALRYPMESDDWVRTVLVGGLLTLLSVLVLPWFFLQGYYVRTLRGVTNDEPEPPSFTDWVDLLVDGLKLFVLNVLVVIVVIAVQLGIAVAMGSGSLLAGSPPATDPGPAAGAAGLLGTLVFVAATLLVSYVVPAMITNFAREDSLAAAFDVSTVLSGALSREFLVAWLLAMVISLTLGLVATALSLLIVGVFGLFYVQIVTYYLFGRGFVEGLDAGSSDGDAVTY